MAGSQDPARHRVSRCEPHGQFVDPCINRERLSVQLYFARLFRDRQCPQGVAHELEILGGTDRIWRVGVGHVRARPHHEVVLLDGWVCAGLESGRIVPCRFEPAGVLKAIDPGLAARLVARNGPDVVGLAIVVPGDDLDNIELVTLFNDGLPTPSVEVVVREVDELLVAIN